MGLLLAVIVMGAVEDEGTFWIQLLMVVILAAGVGVYGLVKSRTKRSEQQNHDEIIETIVEPLKPLEPFEPLVKKRNLSGGMELLDRNFLVGVVEQTDTADERNVAMRRLCFAELARRGELWAIASSALKIYTLDEDGFYGKVIRYEAMAELAGRTRPGEGAAEDSETANEPDRSRTDKSPQSRKEHQTAYAADSAPAFQNPLGLETSVPKAQQEHTM